MFICGRIADHLNSLSQYIEGAMLGELKAKAEGDEICHLLELARNRPLPPPAFEDTACRLEQYREQYREQPTNYSAFPAVAKFITDATTFPIPKAKVWGQSGTWTEDEIAAALLPLAPPLMELREISNERKPHRQWYCNSCASYFPDEHVARNHSCKGTIRREKQFR